MPFDFHARQAFLTYPRCPITPSVAAAAIVALLPGKIDYGLVCQETHTMEDTEGASGQHLHAVLVFKKKFRTRNVRFFDLDLGENSYHPNVQRVRSLQHSIVYVSKEGNVVGIGCDPKLILEAAKKKTSVKTCVIAYKVMEGMSLKEINEEYPGFMLTNLNKVRDYVRWLDGLKLMDAPKKSWNGCVAGGTSPVSTKISKWLNSNLDMKEREPRKLQLWIFGPSATGKTNLLLHLLEHFNGYCIPYDAEWCDGYTDDYDFAYADEFHGQRKITWLNQFVEGCPMPLRQRNSRPYIKKKNLPVIICANASIRDTYKNADEVRVEACEYRFLEVCTCHGERIDVKTEFDSSDEDTAEMLSDEEGQSGI